MDKFLTSPFCGEVSRRLAVKSVTGFAFGAGLKALGLGDVTAASAQSCCEDDTLQLDGDYLVDEASRRAVSFDYGRSFYRLPLAVAKPRTVNDLVRIVQHANEVGLKVAIFPCALGSACASSRVGPPRFRRADALSRRLAFRHASGSIGGKCEFERARFRDTHFDLSPMPRPSWTR